MCTFVDCKVLSFKRKKNEVENITDRDVDVGANDNANVNPNGMLA